MEQNINIRRVEPTETKALIKIATETFVAAFAEFNTPENMRLYLNHTFNEERISNALQNENSTYYFALVDDTIAGYLKINVNAAQSEDLFENSLEIERIYVLPEYIGKGIGQIILEFGLNQAKSQNKSIVWLGVWENNPRAIRFYERNGFSKFSQHPYMMGTDEQTDYLMKCEI